MNRSYSLRATRPVTAAQLASGGPPPVSNARSHRFFNTSLSSAFRKSNAVVFTPELAKNLAVLIKMEKSVMRGYESLSRERKESAKQLSLWGEDCDDDVSDITDKLAVLLYEVGELEDSMVDRYDQYRLTLKNIRNTEAGVQPSRDRKQKLLDQIYYLKHKDPNSQKLVMLEQELVRAEAEYLVAEAQLSNGTRQNLKAAMMYHFDAIQELGEKLTLIAGYGRELLDILDENPVTPGEIRPTYDGYEASKSIILRAEYELNNWAPEKVIGTSNLRTREQLMGDPQFQQMSHSIHHNYNEDVRNQMQRPISESTSVGTSVGTSVTDEVQNSKNQQGVFVGGQDRNLRSQDTDTTPTPASYEPEHNNNASDAVPISAY